MFKKIKKFHSSLNNIFKNQSFKEKPTRTLLYIFLILIFLLFRVKKKYKVNVNSDRNFFIEENINIIKEEKNNVK